MAAADSIIVLDDDDEDEPAAQPGPSHPPPNPVSPEPEASGPSESHGDGKNSHSGGRKCYKLENERLFEEVSFGKALRFLRQGLTMRPGLPGIVETRLALNAQS